MAEGQQQDLNVTVTSSDIANLMTVLDEEVSPYWKMFATGLGLDYATITRIERKQKDKEVREKMIDILQKYKQQKGGEGQTWNNIEKALRNTRNHKLADYFEALPQGNVPFDEDDYIKIMLDTHNLNDVTVQWKMFGLQLGVLFETIKETDDNPGVVIFLMDLLEEWITTKPREATIKRIIEALRFISNHRLADNLPEKDEIKIILCR